MPSNDRRLASGAARARHGHLWHGAMMVRSGKVALIAGITGQDGAYLARFLLEKGYVVHGTSRDAALARLDGLIALGISDQITLHSMSPADFQSVAQVIEAVAADEIYNLSGQSSITLSLCSAGRDIDRHCPRYAQYARDGVDVAQHHVGRAGSVTCDLPIQTQRTQRDRAIQLLANDFARSRKSRQSSAIFLS